MGGTESPLPEPPTQNATIADEFLPQNVIPAGVEGALNDTADNSDTKIVTGQRHSKLGNSMKQQKSSEQVLVDANAGIKKSLSQVESDEGPG